ncbi:MAG TPA: maltose acetyltransferase domain-containing protein, partial [Candidatus Humimicrobiaceae bacterium]
MKSEKEKMLASELYDSGDEELINEFYHASDLTYEFNNTRPSEKAKREDIIKQLINAKGSFLIEAPFNCDYGYNIEVGEN